MRLLMQIQNGCFSVRLECRFSVPACMILPRRAERRSRLANGHRQRRRDAVWTAASTARRLKRSDVPPRHRLVRDVLATATSACEKLVRRPARNLTAARKSNATTLRRERGMNAPLRYRLDLCTRCRFRMIASGNDTPGAIYIMIHEIAHVVDEANPLPHPPRIGWIGTTALAMGGSNQSLFLIAALLAGQEGIPGQGSAAVPLLLLASCSAMPPSLAGRSWS